MGFFDTLANQIQNQVTDGLTKQIENRVDEVVRDNNPLNKINLNLGTGHISSDFEIDAFRQNLARHNEVAKADKFKVLIHIPTAAIFGSGGPAAWSTVDELALQCEVSELPSRDIGMVEYRHYGFTRRIPHTNQYGQVSFTFYCSGDMHEKKCFDSWLDAMVPTNSGLVSYPLAIGDERLYECDIEITQYDPMGNPMYQVKLIDAVPTGMSALNQNWSDDSVHRLTVTFAFRKWLSPATDASFQPIRMKSLGGEITTDPVSEGSPVDNRTEGSSTTDSNVLLNPDFGNLDSLPTNTPF